MPPLIYSSDDDDDNVPDLVPENQWHWDEQLTLHERLPVILPRVQINSVTVYFALSQRFVTVLLMACDSSFRMSGIARADACQFVSARELMECAACPRSSPCTKLCTTAGFCDGNVRMESPLSGPGWSRVTASDQIIPIQRFVTVPLMACDSSFRMSGIARADACQFVSARELMECAACPEQPAHEGYLSLRVALHDGGFLRWECTDGESVERAWAESRNSILGRCF
ncbi:hypothetical protein B0H13DRAFT_1915791 [Mycena leptocephala]|nr:hypothetical protein B0H13DRAFT_1915791 [Mycena leptocephala]